MYLGLIKKKKHTSQNHLRKITTNENIIYGPPGTGKTHTLLQHIEKFLETTDPDKIGYFTFSKNAAIEGKERAAVKFKLSLLDDLPYFQTLHSFCFNQLGLSKDQVMKEKHYKELGEKMD